LLSRTPRAAETVRPDAQIAGKPDSSTIFAESPSWASMRKVSSGDSRRDRKRDALDPEAVDGAIEPGYTRRAREPGDG
jgi:hypothetical protein